MDRIRFPFMFTKEAILKEKAEKKAIRMKNRKEGYNDRLRERIDRLIRENKETFFDPVLGIEIKPTRS